MLGIQDYFLVACIVYVINTFPAFMPPTWTILAFFFLSRHLTILPLILIGASCATLGRMTLYLFAGKSAKILPKKSEKNLSHLGKFFNKNKHISIPIFLLYGFSPIPSNQLFIIAGLAKWDIMWLSLAFFSLRLISYTLWIHAAKLFETSLEGIFSKHYSHLNAFLFDLLGFVIIYLISIIPWNTLLRKTK